MAIKREQRIIAKLRRSKSNVRISPSTTSNSYQILHKLKIQPLTLTLTLMMLYSIHIIIIIYKEFDEEIYISPSPKFPIDISFEVLDKGGPFVAELIASAVQNRMN